MCGCRGNSSPCPRYHQRSSSGLCFRCWFYIKDIGDKAKGWTLDLYTGWYASLFPRTFYETSFKTSIWYCSLCYQTSNWFWMIERYLIFSRSRITIWLACWCVRLSDWGCFRMWNLVMIRLNKLSYIQLLFQDRKQIIHAIAWQLLRIFFYKWAPLSVKLDKFKGNKAL